MKAPRSNSTAAVEPPRFAPLTQIFGFGVVVGLMLLVAFKSQDLVERMAKSNTNDAVSLAYLRIWVRAQPHAYHMRLLLAEHEFTHGNLRNSEDALGPIINTPNDVAQEDLASAQFLLLKIRKYEMWRSKPDTPAFDNAKNLYLAQLRIVSNHLNTPAQLQDSAQEAVALGDYKLSHHLYMRLMQSHPCVNPALYDTIAQQDLAASQYKDAANTYFHAASCFNDQLKQQTYILAGLRALQAGNQLSEAAVASEKFFPILSNDPKSLIFLTRLALASNRPDLAEKYVSQLLDQRIGQANVGSNATLPNNSPNSLMSLTRQAFDSKRPDLAEKYISKLLKQRVSRTNNTQGSL